MNINGANKQQNENIISLIYRRYLAYKTKNLLLNEKMLFYVK